MNKTIAHGSAIFELDRQIEIIWNTIALSWLYFSNMKIRIDQIKIELLLQIHFFFNSQEVKEEVKKWKNFFSL